MQPRPNIVRCLGLLGSVAFSLVGCATTIPDSPEACKFEKLADVPVRMSASNHPIVVIEIDGKLVHMVLDTGATGTLIFASSLERNGMQIDRRVHGMGIGIGGLSKLDILLAERAKIGDLEVKIEHIAVAPFDFSALGGEAIDGILGLDPLGQYDLDLDLPHRRMALYRARYCPNGVPPWENPGRVVPRPANAQYDGRPYAPVSVNGQEFLAMLDTGSNVVIINRHAAATLGVTDQQMAAAPKAMATTASVTAVEARHFRFNSLEFIGLVARDPELAIVELGTGVDLLVGTPILRELRMWIPVQGRKIYFSPPVANN